MEKAVDLIMTRLFQLAEYVCGRCSFLMNEPAIPQKATCTIRFTDEDKPARPKVEMVEGELFK